MSWEEGKGDIPRYPRIPRRRPAGTGHPAPIQGVLAVGSRGNRYEFPLGEVFPASG